MQSIRLVFLMILLVSSQQACNSRKQGDDSATNADTFSAGKPPSTPGNVQISGRLITLGLTPDSDWRGINLGGNFSAVTASEKGEPFESDKKHTGYTIDLPNLETADMLYYQNSSKVSAIEIDLFLNSRQSANQYRSELNSYFTARHGASKPSDGGTLWTSPTGTTVLLKDVSKGKDFGLKIKIAVGGTITSS